MNIIQINLPVYPASRMVLFLASMMTFRKEFVVRILKQKANKRAWINILIAAQDWFKLTTKFWVAPRSAVLQRPRYMSTRSLTKLRPSPDPGAGLIQAFTARWGLEHLKVWTGSWECKSKELLAQICFCFWCQISLIKSTVHTGSLKTTSFMHMLIEGSTQCLQTGKFCSFTIRDTSMVQ